MGDPEAQRWVAHIEDEVCPKALDELVIVFGSGSDDLVSRKLG
jgi:hypothetical protein